jgi:hypothetical protein
VLGGFSRAGERKEDENLVFGRFIVGGCVVGGGRRRRGKQVQRYQKSRQQLQAINKNKKKSHST